jgi:hypothetical protein
MPKVDIPRVIKALEESQNDPDAAIRKLRAESEEREAEAEALRGVAQAIRLITEGVENAPQNAGRRRELADANAGPDDESGPPQGMDAVRRVMKEGGVWTGRAMLDELTKRGWEPKKAKHPLATVEAAMDRLYRVKKEIERPRRGEYVYKGFPASPNLETLTGES